MTSNTTSSSSSSSSAAICCCICKRANADGEVAVCARSDTSTQVGGVMVCFQPSRQPNAILDAHVSCLAKFYANSVSASETKSEPASGVKQWRGVDLDISEKDAAALPDYAYCGKSMRSAIGMPLVKVDVNYKTTVSFPFFVSNV